MPTVINPTNTANSCGRSTFLRITISGRDSAVTAIVKAKTVPIGIPLFTKASVIGITPAIFAYSGTPKITAIGTAKGLFAPAYWVIKSVGT